VFIVDDEPINIELVRIYLQEAGYERFVTTTLSTHALSLIRSERPDVILLDLMMPQVSGFDILAEVRRDSQLRHTPVIILTASNSTETRLRALELGVNDFLAKPVDPSELLLRLRNTLAAKALRDHLASYSARLERAVQARTAELEAARLEAMNCLARAAEYRDDDTGKHVLRVGRYVGILATALGFDERQVEALEQASQLHDVGKIGIPDSILLKPGPLDPTEYDIMKQHCLFGKSINRPMTDEEWQAVRKHTRLGRKILGIPSSPIMKLAASIAETHHEKWDGSGYPHGLAGEEIPIEGRITAVADVFDALSSRRPYKEPLEWDACLEIIRAGRGKHFDPRVVDAFFANLEAIARVRASYTD
jgi:putative two-component system response regulator